jgi:hypothetical protein
MVRHNLILLGAAIGLLFSGCQSLAPKWPSGWFAEEKPTIESSKFGSPVRMAALWSPAMLSQPGKPAKRGFGGRLYFYDGSNKPIPVEGQLVVYAYNESKPNADHKSPDARFAFTPEQFTEHFSPSDLGASYSVWIPWDAVGGPQVDLSLLPVFTATSGQLVVGQSSRNLLPGATTPVAEPKLERFTIPPTVLPNDPQQAATGVQRASYQQPNAGLPTRLGQPASRNVETLSIRVPGSLADRMAQAPPQMPQQAARQTPLGPELVRQRAELIAALNADRVGQQPATSAPAAAAKTRGWLPLSLPQDHFERPPPPAPSGQHLPQVGGPLPSPPAPLGLPSAPP